MNYEMFKLCFETGIHIGQGKLSDAESTIMADTLFSALCQEAVLLYGNKGIERLVSLVEREELLLSDAMPIHDNTFYIPKPMIRIEAGENSDSVLKKQFKKMKYIRFDNLEDYLNGTMDPKEENNAMEDFGKTEIRTMASVLENQDATPFPVGVFQYGKGWGLYFILGYATQETRDFVEDLLMSLEMSGIGGKRSSGLGKFRLDYGSMPDDFLKRLNTGRKGISQMTLSVSMAEDSALETVLQEAQYSIVRRGGFVSSYTYSQSFRRKQDFYMFKAGSTFMTPYMGVLKDVSSGGNHAVYRYGKPLFLELTI